jgi:hypothetical protein
MQCVNNFINFLLIGLLFIAFLYFLIILKSVYSEQCNKTNISMYTITEVAFIFEKTRSQLKQYIVNIICFLLRYRALRDGESLVAI